MRLAPSGVLLSWASRGAVPIWLGFAFALALSAGLATGLSPVLVASAPAALLLAIARELAVGLLFAVAALIPFFALGAGIRLVESEPGQPTPLSTLYTLAAAALTLSLGGLRAYVKALSESLRVLPLAAPHFTRSQLLDETVAMVTQAINAALALGLPLLTAVWLLDLCLSLALRVAHAGERTDKLPLRRALVLGLLSLVCAPWLSRLPELTRGALHGARALLVRLGS
jgi:type III secretory pathway component EscT